MGRKVEGPCRQRSEATRYSWDLQQAGFKAKIQKSEALLKSLPDADISMDDQLDDQLDAKLAGSCFEMTFHPRFVAPDAGQG